MFWSRLWGGIGFLLVGGWMILMAFQGHTPAGPLTGGSRPLIGGLGLTFGLGGVMGLTLVLVRGGRTGIRTAVVVQTASFLALGACFLGLGLFFPEEIGLSVKGISGSDAPASSSLGRVIFIGIGVLTLLGSPLIYKGMIRLLEKTMEAAS